MIFNNRRPWLLWLLLAVVLSITLVNVYAENESNTSLLSPELQDTHVDYEETSDTYVSFPDDAKDLLAQELSDYPAPLMLEVTAAVTQWHGPLWDSLRGLVNRFRDQNQIISIEVCMCISLQYLSISCLRWLSCWKLI
jgi:hypothetical protein